MDLVVAGGTNAELQALKWKAVMLGQSLSLTWLSGGPMLQLHDARYRRHHLQGSVTPLATQMTQTGEHRATLRSS